MISQEEEKFYKHWEKERLQPKYRRRAFLRGLSVGLSLGILVMLISAMGWYERAHMVSNSWGNEIWVIIAIITISVGFAWLYQQFTTEMNEQRFQELKNIKNKK